MKRLDLTLIELMDGLMALLQKRDYSLAAAKLFSHEMFYVMFLASWLLDKAWIGAAIFGSLFMLAYLTNRHEYERTKNYPENVRLTLQLNARAVKNREDDFDYRLRILVMFGFIFFLPIDLASGFSASFITNTIGWFTIIISSYMECAFYLGPGERSHQMAQLPANTASASN